MPSARPTAAPVRPADLLAALPAERRHVMEQVRDVVDAHLPAGYEPGVAYGMLTWSVPLARFPDTYNGEPLACVSLAAQKAHYALYLVAAYQDPDEARWLADAFAAAGRRLDMGKSCLRFKSLDDLPLDVIGAFVARTPPDRFVARHLAARAASTGGAAKQATTKSATRASAKAATKQSATKPPTAKGATKSATKPATKSATKSATKRTTGNASSAARPRA